METACSPTAAAMQRKKSTSLQTDTGADNTEAQVTQLNMAVRLNSPLVVGHSALKESVSHLFKVLKSQNQEVWIRGRFEKTQILDPGPDAT